MLGLLLGSREDHGPEAVDNHIVDEDGGEVWRLYRVQQLDEVRAEHLRQRLS